MDLNLNNDSSSLLQQLLAASLVNAIYTRMLVVGDTPREEAMVEASREVMSLWRNIVDALMGGDEPSEPDVP